MDRISNERGILKQLEKIILSKRGYIVRVPRNEPVIFVMSGGLDSTIGAARAIEEWNCKIYPLFIRRHARATKYEEVAFDKISSYFLKKYPNNFYLPKKVEIEVPPLIFKVGLREERLKKLGHAMRNSTLQNLAVQYAAWLNDTQNLNIRTILAGNVKDDFLPHSSLEAYRAQTILICIDQNDWKWQLVSPFIEPYFSGRPLSKKDNILWAIEKGIPLEYTRTCINDCEVADGTCTECKDRIRAFKEAGVEDPLIYQGELKR